MIVQPRFTDHPDSFWSGPWTECPLSSQNHSHPHWFSVYLIKSSLDNSHPHWFRLLWSQWTSFLGTIHRDIMPMLFYQVIYCYQWHTVLNQLIRTDICIIICVIIGSFSQENNVCTCNMLHWNLHLLCIGYSY